MGNTPFDASDFRAHHALEGDKVSACVETLGELYRLIDEMGLSPRNQARARQALISPIASKAFPETELSAVIRSENG